MTEKINNISQIIRSTEEYSDVCDMCRDEILLYPTISGRTEYTQDEVEQITLKRIIDKLRAKEQECEELKKEKAEIKKYLGISDKTIIQRLEELQEFKDKLKISEYSYKQALDEIEVNILKYQELIFDKPRTMQENDCIYNILSIINQVKEK